MNKIHVTKSFMPPREEYDHYIDAIWSSGQLTNQGPLLKEFESKTSAYLGVDNFHFVQNGTLAMQVALRALGVNSGEVITTPYSYVATTSAILWEGCTPVYADIEPDTMCIDPEKIEEAITGETKAILAVHVYGNPCNVEKIQSIAEKYSLHVIYDGAHAFGAMHRGRSLLDYGDISICSFHATKPFHTIEGGAVIAKTKHVSDKIELIKRFGHDGDDHTMLGINAKSSEFNAAMGLCNLKYINDIIADRKRSVQLYDSLLATAHPERKVLSYAGYNYAYYPVLFEDELAMHRVVEKLQERAIYPRRYFYPSLNHLPYLQSTQPCPVSEDISSRVLCLPLYYGIGDDVVQKICDVVVT